LVIEACRRTASDDQPIRDEEFNDDSRTRSESLFLSYCKPHLLTVKLRVFNVHTCAVRVHLKHISAFVHCSGYHAGVHRALWISEPSDVIQTNRIGGEELRLALVSPTYRPFTSADLNGLLQFERSEL
jgi:hypothetical protein